MTLYDDNSPEDPDLKVWERIGCVVLWISLLGIIGIAIAVVKSPNL